MTQHIVFNRTQLSRFKSGYASSRALLEKEWHREDTAYMMLFVSSSSTTRLCWFSFSTAMNLTTIAMICTKRRRISSASSTGLHLVPSLLCDWDDNLFWKIGQNFLKNANAYSIVSVDSETLSWFSWRDRCKRDFKVIDALSRQISG